MSNYKAWTLQASDFPDTGSLSAQIKHIAAYGVLAPSLHNVQPWQFHHNGDSLHVILDRNRILHHSDPTLRETWISLGCAVEAINIAAKAFGFKPKIQTLTLPDTAAIIKFAKRESSVIDAATLGSITNRFSDRSHYGGGDISEDQRSAIEASWHSQTAFVKVTTDRSAIQEIASYTSRAMGMAMQSEKFKSELSHLIRPSWTKAHDGMPGFTLKQSRLKAMIEPVAIKLGSPERQAQAERKAIESSSGLILVSALGDTPKFWVESGRAYYSANLTAVRHGLACATNAAVVEAMDYHEDIEKSLDLKGRLQTVMRIGYSSASIKHSPRRPVEEVFKLI